MCWENASHTVLGVKQSN